MKRVISSPLPAIALCLLLCLALCPSAGRAATAVQENVVWYRVHLGMGVGDLAVAPAKMHAFIDESVTPLFPNGLTITEARGQWRSPEHGLVRERTTVVDIQCPDTDENWAAIEVLARKYVERFGAAKASVFVKRIFPVTTTLFY